MCKHILECADEESSLQDKFCSLVVQMKPGEGKEQARDILITKSNGETLQVNLKVIHISEMMEINLEVVGFDHVFGIICIWKMSML